MQLEIFGMNNWTIIGLDFWISEGAIHLSSTLFHLHDFSYFTQTHLIICWVHNQDIKWLLPYISRGSNSPPTDTSESLSCGGKILAFYRAPATKFWANVVSIWSLLNPLCFHNLSGNILKSSWRVRHRGNRDLTVTIFFYFAFFLKKCLDLHIELLRYA